DHAGTAQADQGPRRKEMHARFETTAIDPDAVAALGIEEPELMIPDLGQAVPARDAAILKRDVGIGTPADAKRPGFLQAEQLAGIAAVVDSQVERHERPRTKAAGPSSPL